MASMLIALAEKHAGGKIAFLLEGGYDLSALKNSVAAVLEKIKDGRTSDIPDDVGGEAMEPLVRRMLSIQERYWPL